MTDRPEDTLQKVLEHLVGRQDDNEQRLNMLQRLSESAQATQKDVAENLKRITTVNEKIEASQRQIADILASHEHRLNRLDPESSAAVVIVEDPTIH